jgi:hypothetical protein
MLGRLESVNQPVGVRCSLQSAGQPSAFLFSILAAFNRARSCDRTFLSNP